MKQQWISLRFATFLVMSDCGKSKCFSNNCRMSLRFAACLMPHVLQKFKKFKKHHPPFQPLGLPGSLEGLVSYEFVSSGQAAPPLPVKGGGLITPSHPWPLPFGSPQASVPHFNPSKPGARYNYSKVVVIPVQRGDVDVSPSHTESQLFR